MKRDPLTEHTIIARRSEPVAVEVDGTIVLLSIEREKYFRLDGAGVRMWELLEEPLTVGELTRRLVSEFEVEPAQCRADVDEFIDQLLEEGLLEVRDGSSDSVRETPSA